MRTKINQSQYSGIERTEQVVAIRSLNLRWPLLSNQRWCFIAALVSLILVCLPVSPFDMNGHEKVDIYESIALFVGHRFNSAFVGISLIMLFIPAVVALRRSRPAAAIWWVPDVILGDFLLTDALGKDVFPFPRPYHPTEPGFPSGHTVFAFALAWLITEKYPKLGPIWYAIAVVIGWSRIEVHAHYPYQVFAGAIIGVLLGFLVSRRRNGFLIPRIFLSNPAISAE